MRILSAQDLNALIMPPQKSACAVQVFHVIGEIFSEFVYFLTDLCDRLFRRRIDRLAVTREVLFSQRVVLFDESGKKPLDTLRVRLRFFQFGPGHLITSYAKDLNASPRTTTS